MALALALTLLGYVVLLGPLVWVLPWQAGLVVCGVVVAVVGLALVVVTLPGTLVLSRYREYAADRGAVVITGDPAALARALGELHGASDVPETDMRLSAGFTAFCIVPAGYGSLPVPWTHPPTHERIRGLRELAAEMES